MILTAHQPVYLPWLGLFHKIALADTFCFFDDVQYLKKDWNNRNKIKTPQGPLWLTVPVLTTGHREKSLREIEINNTVDWRRKHWRSLSANYSKARYFSRYAEFFEDVYGREWKYLAELNEHMLKWFLKELDINVAFCKASEHNFKGAKSGLILDMCKKLKADTYIFGALGKDYAKEEEFTRAGVKVEFQDYHHPAYTQLHGNFLPYMSIVDLMFNCGERSLEIIMSGNTIKKQV